MLAVCLLALVSQAPIAPATLASKMIEFSYEKALGSCADDAGIRTLTIFGDAGRYVDVEKAGIFSEGGTFEYQRLDDTSGQLTYQVLQAGTWKGGDTVEKLHFDTPTTGSFHGWQPNGTCTYDGQFQIKD